MTQKKENQKNLANNMNNMLFFIVLAAIQLKYTNDTGLAEKH